MKKILYVSGFQIFPAQTGGHLRAANVIKGFVAAGCEVRVYSLSGRRPEYNAKVGSMAHAIGPGITEYVDRRISLGACQSLSGKLQIPGFWEAVYTKWATMPKVLREWSDWCDAVVTNDSYLYPFLSRVKGKLRLINSHNLEHNMWTEHWWQRRIMKPLVRVLEERASQGVDGILCCAQDEQQFFAQHKSPHTTLFDVPNAVFPSEYRADAALRPALRRRLGLAPDRRYILFVGSRYSPNREAYDFLKAFCKEHGPLLERSRLVFLVVGSVSKEVFTTPTMISTGFVDEVLPYFQAADLAINPVERGSGTNVKIFEYLASNLPLLSTEFGVRGFSLEAGRDFFAFTRDSLADLIKGDLLASSPERLAQMAAGAFVKSRHLIDMAAILSDVCERLARQQPFS